MDGIALVPYDAAWPALFETERDRLAAALPADLVVEIAHAGSTAIPGLAAKPIIDIFIAVRDIAAAREDFVAPVTGLGYVYWAENPDRDRLFFVKGMPPFGTARTHHVHVMQPEVAAWQRTLRFRDALRADGQETQRYLDLKQALVALHAQDREAYTRGKDDYISGVVAKVLRPQADPTGGSP